MTRLSARLCRAAVAFFGATSAALAAGPFPCAMVKIVAPNPPGGATDVLARMLAPPLQQRLGVPVQVDNKGGASTNIGTEFVVRAAADGCTWLLGNISMALNKNLFSLRFDVEQDLRAVIQVAAVPVVLFVNPHLPLRTMADFVAYARAAPDGMTFSSAGIGTPTHLIVEMINARFDTHLIHVPYKGAGPATADVIAGQIDASSDSLIPMVPHIRSGSVRALGVTGRTRSPALPETPTFAEQGFGQADMSLWYGVMVPARTPPAIVDRLNREIAAVLSLPDIERRLAELGSVNPRGTPEAFQALLHGESTRLGELIRKAGINPQ